MASSGTPVETLRLCAACGSLAAPALASCETCGAPYQPGGLAVVARDARAAWVRVECRFRCLGCGVLAPLVGLAGAMVSCAHCGMEQPVDRDRLRGLVARAHDLADLSGQSRGVAGADPDAPLARDNPYKFLGVATTVQEWNEPAAIGGREALVVRASPGQPTCATCRAPLALEIGGETVARCPGCRAEARYCVPPEARASYQPLAGVVADEHRSDVARAAVTGAGPTLGLSCPSCGAPLAPPTAEDHTSRCAHCHAVALVSGKLWHRVGRAAPRAEPCWLCFAGPSPLRSRLERPDVDPLQAEIAARARAARLAASGAPLPSALAPEAAEPGATRHWVGLLVLALTIGVGVALVWLL
jgi:hypothetical protein